MVKKSLALLIAAFCLTACEYFNRPLEPWIDEQYELMKKVWDVSVSPQSVAAAPGASRQFSAQVSVRADADQSVTWSVSGAHHPVSTGGATGISAGGLLSVDASEPLGTALTVTATSVFDPGKSAAAIVIVGAGGSTVTVAFDPAGGTWSNGTTAVWPMTVPAGVDVNAPGLLTKGSLTCSGWYTAPNGGGTEISMPCSMPANTTLYARWTYAVTFNANGGDFGGGSPTRIDAVTEGSDVNAPSPAHAVYSGYSVTGWWTATSGGTKIDFPYTPAANTTVYARWAHVIADGAGWDSAIAAANAAAPAPYLIDIGTASVQAHPSGGGSAPPVAANANITIIGSGTITLPATGQLLDIPGGASVTLDGPALQGYSGNTQALVKVAGGAFIMQSGAIKNNAGGGVSITGGSFTMSGGDITGNGGANVSGGGVNVGMGGTFTMSGGTITGNSVSGAIYLGGGVSVALGGTFTMSGGTITGNSADGNNGGGVYAGGSFVLNSPAATSDVTGNTGGNVVKGITGSISGSASPPANGW